jgi:hypothetical protein
VNSRSVNSSSIVRPSSASPAPLRARRSPRSSSSIESCSGATSATSATAWPASHSRTRSRRNTRTPNVSGCGSTPPRHRATPATHAPTCGDAITSKRPSSNAPSAPASAYRPAGTVNSRLLRCATSDEQQTTSEHRRIGAAEQNSSEQEDRHRAPLSYNGHVSSVSLSRRRRSCSLVSRQDPDSRTPAIPRQNGHHMTTAAQIHRAEPSSPSPILEFPLGPRYCVRRR